MKLQLFSKTAQKPLLRFGAFVLLFPTNVVFAQQKTDDNTNKPKIKFLNSRSTKKQFRLLKLKKWKSSEKNQITKLFLQINTDSPILSKYIDYSIPLYRTGIINLTESGNTYSCDAISNFEGIVLPDNFFKQLEQRQIHILVHEIFHLIDVGGKFSYSKEWITFSAPFIFDSRSISPLCGSPFERLIESKVIPSKEAARSVREAYAEFGSRYLLNKSADSRINKYAALKMTAPTTSKDKAFDYFYKEGMICYGKGDYQRAIDLLNKAVEINSNTPVPLYFLAVCHYEKGDYKTCLFVLNKAKESLSLVSSNISSIDPNEFNIFYLQARALLKLEDYENCRNTIRILMQVSSNVDSLKFLVSSCGDADMKRRLSQQNLKNCSLSSKLKEELRSFVQNSCFCLTGIDLKIEEESELLFRSSLKSLSTT